MNPQMMLRFFCRGCLESPAKRELPIRKRVIRESNAEQC